MDERVTEGGGFDPSRDLKFDQAYGRTAMRLEDARLHLDEAMRLLTLEAYRGNDLDNMERVEDFTIAEELERIDRALGPKGSSMFAPMGDAVRSAYVEIKAAREALKAK